ncbi:hypothetical protein HGA88_06360 [Candidatus Roizmanbacteria bacterium]|nr:hypothetical protein [Candidatus Roizmanbacteria bacterium]
MDQKMNAQQIVTSAASSLPQQDQDTSSSEPRTPEEEFRKFVEMEVLQIIKDLAEKTDTPDERIQAIAKLTLEKIQPGMKLEDLYANAVSLDDTYQELGPLVIKIMKHYEDTYETKALTHVSQLIRTGNYDKAQDMVKKVLQFKIFQ